MLCISYRFPPETYPLAIGLEPALEKLRREWSIDAITAAQGATSKPNLRVHRVKGRSLRTSLGWLRKARLGKLAGLLVWPDSFFPWILPALLKARQLIEERRPDVIFVFMMPYSTGFIGMLLKRMTGLPLVYNFDDSPTCSDMHPSFSSRLHYKLNRWMEDRFVRESDAAIYVSKHNMKRVQSRQPAIHQDKFCLIRYGANLSDGPAETVSSEAGGDQNTFRIVYTGAMGGWYELMQDTEERPPFYKRAYRAWQRWGRHTLVERDNRTHSPVFVGQAVKRVLEQHPAWEGRVALHVYGDDYPADVTGRVLRRYGIEEVVVLHDPVSHEEALRRQRAADLLFIALPDRADGSPGGRISAKTYEYLATGRPILAALPPGENWEFLQEKPGTHLTSPTDVDGMADVIESLAGRAFAGNSLDVDRDALQKELGGTARAEAFDQVLRRMR